MVRGVGPRLCPDPLLRSLVPVAGSLNQARNELRWIRQEVAPDHVTDAIARRSTGYPLQYILGSQPFGKLDIACRPGVLIPRWETEEWVTKLSTTASPGTRILDLCTGTGCAVFLFSSLVPGSVGFATDISDEALNLFAENQTKLGFAPRTQVLRHNLHMTLPAEVRNVDVVIANPPYIPQLTEAAKSVREFEPALALVEQPHIYEDLVDRVFETTAATAVFEVGNKMQIDRCIDLFRRRGGWTAYGQRDSANNWRTVWAHKAS